jgi:hypothetical protein
MSSAKTGSGGLGSASAGGDGWSAASWAATVGAPPRQWLLAAALDWIRRNRGTLFNPLVRGGCKGITVQLSSVAIHRKYS